MAKPKKKKLKVKSMELLRAERSLRQAANDYHQATDYNLEWAQENLYRNACAYARLAELADK